MSLLPFDFSCRCRKHEKKRNPCRHIICESKQACLVMNCLLHIGTQILDKKIRDFALSTLVAAVPPVTFHEHNNSSKDSLLDDFLSALRHGNMTLEVASLLQKGRGLQVHISRLTDPLQQDGKTLRQQCENQLHQLFLSFQSFHNRSDVVPSFHWTSPCSLIFKPNLFSRGTISPPQHPHFDFFQSTLAHFLSKLDQIICSYENAIQPHCQTQTIEVKATLEALFELRSNLRHIIRTFQKQHSIPSHLAFRCDHRNPSHVAIFQQAQQKNPKITPCQKLQVSFDCANHNHIQAFAESMAMEKQPRLFARRMKLSTAVKSSSPPTPNNDQQTAQPFDPNTFWSLDAIVAHKLNSKDVWTVKVRWSTGEETWEPLKIIAIDDPVTCARYAHMNQILHLPGWKRFRHYNFKCCSLH